MSSSSDAKRLDLSSSDLSDVKAGGDGAKDKKKGKKGGKGEEEDVLPPVPATQMVRKSSIFPF